MVERAVKLLAEGVRRYMGICGSGPSLLSRLGRLGWVTEGVWSGSKFSKVLIASHDPEAEQNDCMTMCRDATKFSNVIRPLGAFCVRRNRSVT